MLHHRCNPSREGAQLQVETLLPLGKVDPGLRTTQTPLDVRRVFDDARFVEQLGYDGLVVEETKDAPYVVLALAAQATTRLRLGTSVAMAFPRSPTITGLSAWTLQKLSGGRFTLGLGTQVKGHIWRRYGMPWSPPGPWLREYVRARVAFYASTRAYRATFEFHGLGELATRLTALAREQRGQEMPAQISDETLNLCATVGTYDEIAEQLRRRYRRLVTSSE